MADKKISALSASTTPLAGTEVLPIVQAGATLKVSVDNLTSGKTVPANGIQFPATQVTSSDPNTLDDYEEGTWTPIDVSGAGLTFGGVSATYTKIGRQVICALLMDYPITVSVAIAEVGGLPFVSGSYGSVSIQGFICVRNSSFVSYGLTGAGGASSFKFDKNSATANAINADLSNTFFAATIIYQV